MPLWCQVIATVVTAVCGAIVFSAVSALFEGRFKMNGVTMIIRRLTNEQLRAAIAERDAWKLQLSDEGGQDDVLDEEVEFRLDDALNAEVTRRGGAK